MVFIDRIKDVIKIFEECSREEIGISLLAYEEFICKGLKVSDKDLERLTNIFEYYDEELSDDFPSLTNEALQNSDVLICDCLNDTNKLEKDGYEINIHWNGRSDNATSFDVEIVDKKTGVLESDINYNVKDEFINSDYGKDSFNTVYNAWEEVHKQMKKTDIKSITNTYKV